MTQAWQKRILAAVFVLSAGMSSLAAEDRDPGITHFRSHALAEIAGAYGPDQGLKTMAVDVRLVLLQNPLSPADVTEFGNLARGLPEAPPANQALILDVLTQMLKAARDPQSANIPGPEREAALGAAIRLSAEGATDSRAAALRYLRETGDGSAIGPAIAALQGRDISIRLEAAFLLHDHASGPEAARIRAAITRADPAGNVDLQRLFTSVLQSVSP